jgi:ParB-like chromosome segregation protein Spo0J
MAAKRKPRNMVVEQEYELVDVDRIQPHPDNPRLGAQLEVEVSIDKNGWYGVCTVQKSTGNILAGNHRYKAALAHGAKQVPVAWLDIDDEHAKRIMLADNRIADLGSYDQERLDGLLESLPSLEGTGYELAEEVELEEKPVPEDDHAVLFGVIVMVETEEEQEAVYEKLSNEGYNIRLVAV